MNLNQEIVLVLNSSWLALHFKSVREAIVSLCIEDKKANACVALDIIYDKDPVRINDEWDFNDCKISNITPFSWDEWLKLPIRIYDNWINTPHLQIRIPTVIVASNFNKMILKRFHPNKKDILIRDNFTCQYSGKKLSNHNSSLDHIIPRSKGGRDSWLNLVACAKEVNSKKGNRSNEEAGLTLLKQPSEPNPVPISSLIREARHYDQIHFLIK